MNQQQTEAIANADAHLNNAALPTYSELQSVVRLLTARLHPGAIGLIYTHHGAEAGVKASNAVYTARVALQESPLRLDLVQEQALATAPFYARLHDMLSDMIDGGRLRKEDIPEDYMAIVETLEQAAIAENEVKA